MGQMATQYIVFVVLDLFDTSEQDHRAASNDNRRTDSLKEKLFQERQQSNHYHSSISLRAQN